MKPNFDLKNKVAVITGGGGALGGCVAQSLSQSGVKIAILDLIQESAQRTVDIIEKEGGTAIGFAANVLSQESIETVSKQILKEWVGLIYCSTQREAICPARPSQLIKPFLTCPWTISRRSQN